MKQQSFFLNKRITKTRTQLAFLNGVLLQWWSCGPRWFFAMSLHSSPIKWDLHLPTAEFPQANWSQITIAILRALHSLPWASIHPQPGWGQNLPTVSHGTAGRLRGLGGICAFPSVAHSLLSKPLPLSAAICFQLYPTGRKYEHFHHRIWTTHKLEREKKKKKNSLWQI